MDNTINSYQKHISNYQSEYRDFLEELGSEDLKEKEQNLLKEAEGPFNSISTLRALFDLHLSKLHRIAKDPEPGKVTPLFLKRVERLDRLMGKNHPNGFKRISEFTFSYVPEVTQKTVKNDAFSANPSVFVMHPERNKKVALFKPINAESSPCKGVVNSIVTQRQVGAYPLSRHQSGVDVPLSLFTICGEDAGSLQMFRKNDGDLTTLSAQERFNLPVNTLHRATLFRGRLYDLDAHLGNMLWRKKGDTIRLTHIDLDYTLPIIRSEETDKVQMRLGWVYFPQLDKPFQKEVFEEISQINIQEETDILKSLPVPIEPESLELLQATTRAFQIGAELGLTPGNIIDALSTETFKESFRELSNSALRAFLLEIKTETTKTYQVMVSAQDNLNSAEHFITEQIYSRNPFQLRYAVKFVRELILSKKLESNEILHLITPFQGYVATDRNRFLSAVSSFADSFEVIEEKQAAKELNSWVADQNY